MESVVNTLCELSIKQIRAAKRKIIQDKIFGIRDKIEFLKLCNWFIRYKRRKERGERKIS